ncbi:MAG: AAC(3) family N-acetyltransferase [Desulfomonilaceae bacterium]
MKELVKNFLSSRAIAWFRRRRIELENIRFQFHSPLSKATLKQFLCDELGLQKGDVVFVHSSAGNLRLTFPVLEVIQLLRDVIGEQGTLLFPTYPRQLSYEFLVSGEIFDVRRSRSYTGLLTEFARRQKDAVRSLHPTKSVCAIGPLASELTQGHNMSPYPYDHDSPYQKVRRVGGKIIGIGVSSAKLSFVHTVDDTLKEAFPVEPYHKEIFPAKCVSYENEIVVVKTYAHDMRKMKHNIPKFMKRYCDPGISLDLTLQGMRFFVAQTKPLYQRMIELARDGITVYERSVYK